MIGRMDMCGCGHPAVVHFWARNRETGLLSENPGGCFHSWTLDGTTYDSYFAEHGTMEGYKHVPRGDCSCKKFVLRKGDGEGQSVDSRSAELAKALGEILVAAKVVNGDVGLTGPHLLLAAQEYVAFLKMQSHMSDEQDDTVLCSGETVAEYKASSGWIPARTAPEGPPWKVVAAIPFLFACFIVLGYVVIHFLSLHQ